MAIIDNKVGRNKAQEAGKASAPCFSAKITTSALMGIAVAMGTPKVIPLTFIEGI
jgi:hypothetical protein